jgi:glycosyltransferase involved in cell wall biosynthesis
MRRLVVNQAYAGQRITGQQRYAVEIARALEGQPGVTQATPSEAIASSGARSWLWVQTALPWMTRKDVLLSLTSRAPLVHRRHIVVVHDLFVITNPEWYSREYVVTHVPLLKANLRDARVIVTVSEPVADQVRELGLSSAPVVVAPNAPSPVFSAPRGAEERTEVLARHGVTDGGYLLAVGSMDPRKNLPRLAEAYLALPAETRAAVPLVLVGARSAVFGDVDLAASDDIKLAGYVSDDELAVLYAASRGVVFPSLAEGFGLPLVEAMVSGARLAVSDIPVFHWICGDDADYFSPGDVSAVTDALARLAAAPPLDEDEAARIRRAVTSRFDWRMSARTVHDAYQSIGTR